jgi:hypothetical protein
MDDAETAVAEKGGDGQSKMKRGRSIEFVSQPARRMNFGFGEDSPAMRSRPCSKCAKRGLRVPAHRIMLNGEGLCADCYDAERKRQRCS